MGPVIGGTIQNYGNKTSEKTDGDLWKPGRQSKRAASAAASCTPAIQPWGDNAEAAGFTPSEAS